MEKVEIRRRVGTVCEKSSVNGSFGLTISHESHNSYLLQFEIYCLLVYHLLCVYWIDFQDFNYITSSGTTLGEMLSTENFLESYGYDSKSPDDIFGDDDDTNDFVAIIKQEPGFEYHDYQVNTSPESEMSSFEDQLQLVNTSNDLMSVDLEYLMNMQKVPAVKQEHENVVIKVEAIDSGVFTDESVPVFSHEGKYLLT